MQKNQNTNIKIPNIKIPKYQNTKIYKTLKTNNTKISKYIGIWHVGIFEMLPVWRVWHFDMLTFLICLFEGVWLQTIRHRCPSAWGFPGREARFCYPLLPGLTSLKRFVFRGLMRVPPRRLAFKAFLAQNRTLLRVWRHVFFLTSVLVEWIGPRTYSSSKVCGFVMLSVWIFRKPL